MIELKNGASRAVNLLLLASLVLMIPGNELWSKADECIVSAAIAIGALDSLLNNRWRRYWLFWSIILITVFYTAYSLWVVKSNVPVAILSDALVQIKPYVALAVALGAANQLTPRLGLWLKWIGAVMALIGGAMIWITYPLATAFGHFTIWSNSCFVGACSYLLGVTAIQGSPTMAQRIYGALMMGLGTFCQRARYLASTLIGWFMVLVKPSIGFGRLSGSLKGALGLLVIVGVGIVAYPKLDRYFFHTDPQVAVASDAHGRRALIQTSVKIYADYLPFGSGLASFASNQSAPRTGEHYSPLYKKYGINQVYGLTRHHPAIINDCYIASVAQLGIVGLVLIAGLWLAILYQLIHRRGWALNLGFSLWAFLLIDSTTSSIIVQPVGVASMLLIATILNSFKNPEKKPS
ncbi:MAG: hypothetical protein LIO90_11850 [Bacteroidales bacterium]|nr:hypothetical protein [Bacteroidales bacterium]